jgi:hypothetical protein
MLTIICSVQMFSLLVQSASALKDIRIGYLPKRLGYAYVSLLGILVVCLAVLMA